MTRIGEHISYYAGKRVIHAIVRLPDGATAYVHPDCTELVGEWWKGKDA